MFEAEDARTLSLSVPVVDAASLDAFLQYAEVYVRNRKNADDDADTVAEAHARALASSELKPRAAEALRAVVRRFAGNRTRVQALQAHATELEAKRKDSDRDAERWSAARTLLERLDEELGLWEGPVTLALMKAREPRLMDAHAALTRLG